MRILGLALVGLVFLVSCPTLYPNPTPIGTPNPTGTNPNVQSGVLTAGDIDENLNIRSLTQYLTTQKPSLYSQTVPTLITSDQVAVEIKDSQGLGVANARIQVFNGENMVFESVAGANGIFYFYPNFDSINAKQLTLKIRPPTGSDPALEVPLNLESLPKTQVINVTLALHSRAISPALDLLLVIDATGSMGDEMQYLNKEFQAISGRIAEQFPDVSTRFGLIVYRDIGDDYVVRSYNFTDSVATMQNQLIAQSATGGGDTPEAMEQALERAMQAQWRDANTTRLLFLVADAPPHNEQLTATINHAKTARRLGIRMYPLAASGTDDMAEYLMRIMAVTTHGRYLFLTNDSGVGNPHSEPKIPCYITTRLDQLLTRVIASELSGSRVEASQNQIIRTVGTQTNGICN